MWFLRSDFHSPAASLSYEDAQLTVRVNSHTLALSNLNGSRSRRNAVRILGAFCSTRAPATVPCPFSIESLEVFGVLTRPLYLAPWKFRQQKGVETRNRAAAVVPCAFCGTCCLPATVPCVSTS